MIEIPAQRRFSSRLLVGGLVAAGIIFRLLWIDHLPGINGDETWYGVELLGAQPGHPPLWRTPSGNLLNPFFSAPLWGLLKVFGPFFWVLRVPAVISGLACIPIAYFLWRRFLRPSTATSAAILFATLPIVLAYSRIGWDPSQIIPAGMLVIGFSLTGRVVPTAVAFVVAVWIHPTNVFLAPLVLTHWTFRIWVTAAPGAQRRFRFASLAGVALGALLVVKLLFLPARTNVSVPAQLLDVVNWQHLAVLFGEMLSGISTYRYFVGPLSPLLETTHAVVFWALFLAVVGLGTRQLIRARDWRGLSHVVGFVLMYIAFQALGASLATADSGNERYALVLVAPAVLLWLMALENALRTPRAEALAHQWAVPALGALFLLTFSQQYFARYLRTGGEAHRTYRTAAVEPKEQAADIIRAQACESRLILAEDWWLEWPLRFLFLQDPRTQVRRFPAKASPIPTASATQCIFAVTFAGSAIDRAASQSEPPHVIIDDAGEHPLLDVIVISSGG